MWLRNTKRDWDDGCGRAEEDRGRSVSEGTKTTPSECRWLFQSLVWVWAFTDVSAGLFSADIGKAFIEQNDGVEVELRRRLPLLPLVPKMTSFSFKEKIPVTIYYILHVILTNKESINHCLTTKSLSDKMNFSEWRDIYKTCESVVSYSSFTTLGQSDSIACYYITLDFSSINPLSVISHPLSRYHSDDYLLVAPLSAL